jgi:uncharacterized protein YdeI (YjbR/CyaY-like superfamily)
VTDKETSRPVFFKTPAELRRWFAKNHAKLSELWVGYYKKDSGKPSITWPQSVDEALCVGWIDGIRKSIDEVSYKIRFTPRRPRSIWSAVNTRRVAELQKEGRMKPEGLAAFTKREEYRSGIYTYEQRSPELPAEYARIMKQNPDAAKFYEQQPPGYRKAMNWRILCAKKEETRLKRLEELIHYSAKGQQLPQFVALTKRKRKP